MLKFKTSQNVVMFGAQRTGDKIITLSILLDISSMDDANFIELLYDMVLFAFSYNIGDHLMKFGTLSASSAH